jgi:autotransporter translocation and assembly factor TamB
MSRGAFRGAVAALAIFVAVAAGVVVFHDAVAGAALRAVATAFGYPVAFAQLHAGLGGATVAGVRVTNRAGEPVFAADRIAIGYALRDFFPGSRHRYGISVVEVAHPELTLIHHPDGTYNVTLPRNPANNQPNHTPLALRARVRDGSVVLIDRFVDPGQERRQRMEGLSVDLAFAPHERSFYDVRFALDDGRATHPVHGKATFDDDRGFEDQHWVAPLVPIGALVDFALSSHQLNLVDGELRGVDVRLYAIVDAQGARHLSVTGRAALARGKLYVAGLVAPVRDAHGPLALYDDGLTTTAIDATLAGTPLHVTGGVYGLRDPRIDVAVSGGGALTRLRTIVDAGKRLDVTGDLAYLVRAQGRLAQPFLDGTFGAPRIVYKGMTFSSASGALSASGRTVDVLDVRADYGRVALAARGRLQLEHGVDTDLVVSLGGDPAAIPYAAELLGREHLAATVHLVGNGGHLATSGVLFGDGPGGRLAGVFSVDANGDGVVGPLAFDRSDGASLYARAELGRTSQSASGIVDVRRLTLRGISLDAHVAGEIGAGGAAIGALRLRAPFGTANGSVRSDGTLVAFTGRAQTPWASAPVRVLADIASNTLALQLPEIAFGPAARAALHGIALRGGSATVVKRGSQIEVRAARVELAGGSVVAQGTLGDAGTLRVAGAIPFAGGTLTAIARLRGSLNAPRGNVGIALAGASYGGAPVSGDAFARYDGNTLTLRDAVVLAAGAVITANGTVRGFARGATPVLDAHTTVRGAELATLARLGHVALRYPDGALDGDVHVSGPLAAPHLDGTLGIARGSINGLAFRDARVAIAGGVGELVARDGRVSVGSTDVAFSGTFGRALQQLSLRAPHANLADFNDYFDRADTLGGTGRLAIDADLRGGATTGDVAFRNARYRQYALGDVGANWHTAGSTVIAQARVAGPHGTATLAGTMALPGRTVAADARVTGFDLGGWLTTAGINAPVNGVLDASAHASGPLGALAFTTDATISRGVAGHYAFDRIALRASGDRSGARIDGLDLAGPGLIANAHGAFGYRANDPVALALHAQSDDLALLTKSAALPAGVAGAATVDVALSGTRAAPRVTSTLAADNVVVHDYRIPHAGAQLVADSSSLTLRDATVDLQRGQIRAAADIAIGFSPARLAFREAPLHAELHADAVDLAQFVPLFPKGTHAAGTLSGTLTVAGTPNAPSLDGSIALAGGNFSSPLVRSPLANARGQLAFAGTQMRIVGAHADVNGGSLDLGGTASVANLRDPLHALAFDVTATAQHAGLDIAREFAGKVDGQIEATQSAGGIPVLTGNVAIAQARIPLSAVLPSNKPASQATPFPVAFALGIAVGSDVRVQSQNVDVGFSGRLQAAGTLANPDLRGAFRSTDGTVSFYRTFVLQHGRVAFDPADGIVPNVDATATTEIPDPPTSVLLHVTGPATHLNLELASDPSYDRAQILGLLVNAQALGAVSGVATTGTGGGFSVASLGEGYLAQQFTRTLLQPLGGEVGRSLGLSDLNLGYDFTSGLSIGASRALGKHVNLAVKQSLGADERQSLALEAQLKGNASLQLTVFGSSSSAVQALPLTSPLTPVSATAVNPNLQLESLAPPPGSSGFAVTYQRKYR